MEKIQFVFWHYMELALFLASCYGFGEWVIRKNKVFAELDKGFLAALALCLGIGIFIFGLQLLGIAGLLNKVWVTTLLVSGHASLLIQHFWRPAPLLKFDSTANAERTALSINWWVFLLSILIFIYLLPTPLHPPTDWDEVECHLPHAREWAAAGKLTVNIWLRYPLLPYNFNLLYAAGLIYGSELFAHLAYASAGWLVAFGLFRIAKIYFGSIVASISVLIFILLTKGQYGSATTDLGVVLFIFFGFSCVFFWWEKKRISFLYVGVFLIGVASGIKYHSLTFLPLLAVIVLSRERRPRHLLGLLAVLALPCGYWYLRNYFISGNPFNPMGGELFGYWDWDAEDMASQFADVRGRANWPKPYIWPALGALFLRKKFSYLPFRAAVIFSIYAFIVWFFTSHYERYLLPAFPILALLTAVVISHLYAKLISISKNSSSRFSPKIFERLQNGVIVLLLAGLTLGTFISFSKDWKNIKPNAETRSQFLKNEIRAFEIGEFLKQHPEYRIVQIGLESDMYYLPPNTIGDWFGPGRYRSFFGLTPQALAEKLKSLNANGIVIATKHPFFKTTVASDNFKDYFVLIKKSEGAELYGVK
jgi:hypothetical protein